MSYLSEKSEYAGIRIAMHDALQRYYIAGGQTLADAEKIPTLQRLVREACHDNRLLGNRNNVVGEAWAEFIGTRAPSKILAFLADPAVITYSTDFNISTPLKDKASTLNFLDAIQLLFKSRNFAFEQIAQRTGLIDYSAGETLSNHLQEAEAHLVASGAVTPTEARSAETPEQAEEIRRAFDTPLGNVDPTDMGLPPKSLAENIGSESLSERNR